MSSKITKSVPQPIPTMPAKPQFSHMLHYWGSVPAALTGFAQGWSLVEPNCCSWWVKVAVFLSVQWDVAYSWSHA